MELGLVHKINIDDEMQQSYLDYAMSVIIARALPDARDGLKPVHRRILYAMHDMGLRPNTPYKKSARIVGEVLGKYHPHGDMAVYESMARMAQDFSMRYLLIEGQGNFGSVDGDPPAAMRYTEARLAAMAGLMLADIDKQTVNRDSNFDGTLTEPVVLPAALPNLLVNGATGIAVGMATSIPPHNLGEVIDALLYMIEHWDKQDDLSIEDLMQFVQGPDFPTGGIILQESDSDGLASAYSTGRGRVTVQASAHLEEMERGRNRIIVTELPYLTNKSSLIERIASLVRDQRLEGIADLRDESDRQGMRIVIELNKAADPLQVLSELYKSTPMQSTFSIIMLALVAGEPRLLGLKQALRVYVEHRLEIVRRRNEYELEKARQREHILAGLRIAILNLDEVIDIIRKSADAEAAHTRLIKRFKLSDTQAQAILDMPLKRLAALERKKIEEEYKQILTVIKDIEGLLRSARKLRQVVADELLAVKETYADRRRTHIVHLKEGEKKISMLTASELTPEKSVWVSVTSDGLISRSHDEKPAPTSGKETPQWTVQANTRDTLYLVDEKGETAAVAVHAIPEAEQPSNGIAYTRATALKQGAPLAAIFRLAGKDSRKMGDNATEEQFIVTATQQGMVKKTSVTELPGPSANTFTLAKVNEGDQMGWVLISQGQDDLLFATARGMAIRFSEAEVRPMGLVAAGVLAIKLQPSDTVIGMEIAAPGTAVCFVASDGTAKRVPVSDFSQQGRYGQGLQAWKLPEKVTVVGIASGAESERLILFMAKLLPKAIRLGDIALLSRTSRGKLIVEVKTGDHIKRLAVPWALEATAKLKNQSKRPARKTSAQKPTAAKMPASRAANKKTASPAKSAAAKPASKPTASPTKAPAAISTEKKTPSGAATPAKKATTPRQPAKSPAPPATPKTGGKTASKPESKVPPPKASSSRASKPEKLPAPATRKPAPKTSQPKVPAQPTSGPGTPETPKRRKAGS